MLDVNVSLDVSSLDNDFVFDSFSFCCWLGKVDVAVVLPICRLFFPIAALPKADCLFRDDGVDDGADEERAKYLCCRCDIVRWH